MQYKQGDLVTLFKQVEFNLIAQQCNCFNVMGGGIAGVLCEHFPAIMKKDEYDLNPVSKYGTIQSVKVEQGIIVNMFSQFQPGSCTKTGIDSFEVRLGALRSCLDQINREYTGATIGLPLIASGIAASVFVKKNMSDLQYFTKFIAPVVEQHLFSLNVVIVYL